MSSSLCRDTHIPGFSKEEEMSTSVIGAGSVLPPNRLSRVALAIVSLATAISIGIGVAQSDTQDLTVDRFHPGHPQISEDRQERVAALREARVDEPRMAPERRR
jgi:hypothetical protein